MPRVSKYPVHHQTNLTIQDYFTDLITSLTTKTDVEDFLDNFLTHEEKVMLAKRLVLYIMIKQRYSSSEIQTALHLTRETVRIHKNQYGSKSHVFHAMLDKLIAKDKTKELWKKLEKVLKPFDLAFSAKTNMKARAKFASGDWS